MIEIIFWGSLFAVMYTYLIYPILLFLYSKVYQVPHEIHTGCKYTPYVSLIIAAYNEERVIESKIQNSLAIDYPRDKIQIIVVSDGSTDATTALARRFAEQGIISLHQPERRGKTAALNRGVAEATGDIIIFSDANNHFGRDAVRKMVRHFVDERIGGVSGLKYIEPMEGRESSKGDGYYWRYESFLKSLESRVGSITGGDGEIFAIRKKLYKRLDESIINDDAAITFDIVKTGSRVIYETEGVSTEYASISLKDDFFVKVRMVAGGFQTISIYRRDLLPPRSLFALQFISHKVLRWLIPEFLIISVLANVALINIGTKLYITTIVLQVAFYILSGVGYLLSSKGQPAGLLYFPAYFCTMNAAAFIGFMRYINRTQNALWRKAAR